MLYLYASTKNVESNLFVYGLIILFLIKNLTFSRKSRKWSAELQNIKKNFENREGERT